jgi:hypothetical protein
MAFSGDFTPVLAKHSKSFSLVDCLSVGVDRMQRNFEPMRKQVEAWQRSELTDVTAKVVIYEAFIEGRLEALPNTSPACMTSTLLRAKIRGIPATDDLESLECVHVGIQGTGSHPAIQGNGEVGRFPGDSILTIVLASGAVSAGRPF